MNIKTISWLLFMLIGSSIFWTACDPNQDSQSVSSPTEIGISASPTTTVLPTKTAVATKTPVPINYVTIGSAFIPECGETLVVVDNSLNGTQNDFIINNLTGHADFWPGGCTVTSLVGEIIAPVTGKIGQTPHAIQICLPPNAYLEGLENALAWMGKNYKPSDIERTCIEFGHITLLPGINMGDTVQKGQSIGDVEKGYGGNFYKLSYHVFLFPRNGPALMTSPTIYRHDTYVEPNFVIPSTGNYELIFPDGLVPFRCEPKLKQMMGNRAIASNCEHPGF